jgi:hypothetical protein
MVLSVSQSSGKLKPYFSANFLLASWVSKLTPKISAFFFW